MENDRVVKIVNFVSNSENVDEYDEATKEYLTSITKDTYTEILSSFQKHGHIEKIYKPEKYEGYQRFVIDLKKNGIYKTIIPNSDEEYIERMQEMYEKDLLKRTKDRRVKNIKHGAKLALTAVLVATTIGVAAKSIPLAVRLYGEKDAKTETIMEEMNRIMDNVESNGGKISPEAAYNQALQNINAKLDMENQESKGIR